MTLIGYDDAPLVYIRLYNWFQVLFVVFGVVFLVPKFVWRSFRRSIVDVIKGKKNVHFHFIFKVTQCAILSKFLFKLLFQGVLRLTVPQDWMIT